MKHTFRNVISKLHNLTETEGDRGRREGQSQSDTGGRGREGLRAHRGIIRRERERKERICVLKYDIV